MEAQIILYDNAAKNRSYVWCYMSPSDDDILSSPRHGLANLKPNDSIE